MIDHDVMLCQNKDIEYIFHGNIMECDMCEASVQLSDVFNLLPKDKVEQLKLLSKKERVKMVGCIQRDDPEFSKRLHEHLMSVRKDFIALNKISDDDIVCLNHDAIFINTNKKLINKVDNIEFKIKHTWNSYIRYNNIEMYYNDLNGTITYKNIPSDVLACHTIGLCRHFVKLFCMLENYDEDVLQYLSRFQQQYLQNKLSDSYYIPFGKPNGPLKTENLKILAYLCKIALREKFIWKNNKK